MIRNCHSKSSSVATTLAAGLLATIPLHAASFADGVAGYSAGTGAAPGYTDPSRALGEPSRTTPFGSDSSEVTPFNPPWAQSQLVSVGGGGYLTLSVSTGIQNTPDHLYGIDFILFGNNGFMVTDYSVPTEHWTTDGNLFSFDPPGASKVSVSADGVTFYTLLVPAGLAVQPDSLYPTDSAGAFDRPVNPRLRSEDFAGKDLAAIRALYAGSAGGTGFDLDWAIRPDGSPANLAEVRYVRLDVLEGKAEVDGLAVVPEPSLPGLLSVAGIASALLVFRRRAR